MEEMNIYCCKKMVQFKYMGIPLDQSDEKLLAVFWKIRRAQKVWGRLEIYCNRRGQIPMCQKCFI